MTLEFPRPDGDARDDKFLELCGTVSRIAAASILLAGSLDLLEWLFLKGGFPRVSLRGAPAAGNAALTYLLAGTALWFLERGRSGRRAIALFVDGCAIVTGLSGAAALGWYAAGWSSRDGTAPLSVLSPGTALAFLLAGGAILLVRRRRGGLAASLMAVGVCILGILGLMAYAYDAEQLARTGVSRSIPFLSVLERMLLGVGILAGMKDQGIMGFLGTESAGSVMARRLLPAIGFVPILFGLFRNWGVRLGLFGDEFGLDLMVVFSIAALALVVWWNAVLLNRSQREEVRSERLRARQAGELRRTAELLEKIFSNIHLNIAILDPRAVILRVNRSFADSFGCPPDYFVGRGLFELLPDEEVRELFRKAAETGESCSRAAQPHVFRAHAERGMTYWDWSLQPIRDAGGTVSELALFLADVTEKVRTESLLRVEEMLRARQEEELRRTAELLETIFSNIYINVAYLDPRFTILRVNRGFAEAYGHPVAHFAGRTLFDLFSDRRMPWDDETRERFRKAAETGETLTGSSHPVSFPEHPERGTTWWDWTLQPIRKKDGSVGGLIFSMADVTEKEHAKALLREKEEAEIQQEKVAALGLMAAGIAHEVRNPLTGLNFSLASAEHLCAQEEEELGPEERETLVRTLASARAASVRIGEVIRRVMDFVRPGKILSQRMNANEVVREALELSYPMLRKKEIRVEMALSDELPPFSGDYRAIEQVVLNLIANAAQALEGWEGEKRIVVSSRKEGRGLLLSVADSGPGVGEQIREKIFTPFYTTKQGGTGLGLSISRKIVSDHGGTIRVEAGRLGGAEFLVFLPASMDDETAEQR